MLDHDNISDTNGILGRRGWRWRGVRSVGWKLRQNWGQAPQLCAAAVLKSTRLAEAGSRPVAAAIRNLKMNLLVKSGDCWILGL